MGSSFLTLSVNFARKHSTINPHNKLDNKCFKLAILARYVDVVNKGRVDSGYRTIENKFDFDGIEFPTPI